MKLLNTIPLFLLIILISAAHAQPGYGKRFWKNNTGETNGVSAVCSDTGFIIVGEEEIMPGYNTDDIRLIKTDANGDTLWTKLLEKQGTSERILKIKQCADSGFIMAGYTDNEYSLWPDSNYLLKTDKNGNIQWYYSQPSIPGSDLVAITTDVVELGDGSFMATSQEHLFATNVNFDSYIFKINKNGNRIWHRRASADSYPVSMQATPDNGFIITGQTYATRNDGLFLLKADKDGYVIWEKEHLHQQQNYGVQIFNTAYGYIVLAQNILFAADHAGDSLWTRVYWPGMPHYAAGYFTAMSTTYDGGYIIGGIVPDTSITSYGFKNDNKSMLVMKINAQGDSLWSAKWGIPSSDDVTVSVHQTSDSGFILTGYTNDGGGDVLLYKTNHKGEIRGCYPLTSGGGGQPYAICPYDSAIFAIEWMKNDTLSFRWFRNDTLLNNTTAEFSTRIPGSYKVIASKNGCTDTSGIFKVTHKPLPFVDAGADIMECLTPNIHSFYGAPSGGIWSGPDITPNSADNSVEMDVVGPGKHKYTYTVTANGCENTDSLFFTLDTVVPATPVITASGPVLFCEGDSVTIEAPAGYPVYQWNTTVQNKRLLTIYQGGTYWVRVNNKVCYSDTSNKIIVTVHSIPSTPSISQVWYDSLASSATGISYEWQRNGILLTDTLPVIRISQNGNYKVRARSAEGCFSEFSTPFFYNSAHIPNKELPQVNVYPNPAVNEVYVKTHGITALQVKIYDITGRLIASSIPNGNNGLYTIDISSLKPGLYFIVAENDGMYVPHPFVKE
ncbi:MAG TPA: T9SS type A sorting domain-containing protein [Bacteroidia bacterium]|nr:T9SS type A sorting domain-containing protein [Bacteroidia bacterium]